MKFDISLFLSVLTLSPALTSSFSSPTLRSSPNAIRVNAPAPLHVSIGLGPKKENPDDYLEDAEYTYDWKGEKVLREDHDEPEIDSEPFRKTRLGREDKICDAWFASLLGSERESTPLGSVSEEIWDKLLTPVKLVPEPRRQWDTLDNPDWSPMVSTRLPGKATYPAFGLENYALPPPRARAECWRQFNTMGMVNTDYSGLPEGHGTLLHLSEEDDALIRSSLETGGSWLDDTQCSARLVYIDGRYCPTLSKTSEMAYNLTPDKFEDGSVRPEISKCLSHLTDGYRDELCTEPDTPNNLEELAGSDLYSELSSPDHNFRRATMQIAINSQSGTASFAALNSLRTGAVAIVDVPSDDAVAERVVEWANFVEDVESRTRQEQHKDVKDKLAKLQKEVFAENPTLPIMIVNAITANGGNSDSESAGTACHPRTLVIAGKGSQVSVIQSCVDLNVSGTESKPRLYNGYTQLFIREGAQVKHCYIQETGGTVTANTEEVGTAAASPETQTPRQIESVRPEVQDTHLECIDVQCTGRYAHYIASHLGIGGSGKIRIATGATLLQKGTECTMSGLMLSGGGQSVDMRANIHHVSPLATSRQNQRNLVGGRSVATFRGRVRIEKYAQQTNSDQLVKTLLLSDKATIWAMPSLEIIAPDVRCTHGATVADLSDEEIFYFQTRGLNRMDAKNMLMFGFIDEIGETVEPVIFGKRESGGLKQRVAEKLTNIAPRGNKRKIKWEYTSM